MPNDSLYRISLKCLITNDSGEVLVVKEVNRDAWDLPGGGIDYDEDITTAVGRELYEEVGFKGEFTYRPLFIDEPVLLRRGIWQMRIVLQITTDSMEFAPGKEADDVAFMDPSVFQTSQHEMERKIYEYAKNA